MRNVCSHIGLAVVVVLTCLGNCYADARIGLQNLKCEMLNNPLGIGTAKPRLSWQITSDTRNTNQVAYQILVASSPEKLTAGQGDLWDSHRINSAESIMVDYAGKPLSSRAECYWKVRVWTDNGASAWSQLAKWSVGLLNPADWKAKWIGCDRGFAWDSVSKFSRLSARYYRRGFNLNKAIKRATAYVVGLGHYELYLNGEAIGDQVLAEAPTDYTQSVKYNTFDVTACLKRGDNAIGTVLGNGRYFTMRPKYKPKKIKEFGFPKMLLQLEVEYTDGSKQTIVSDNSWHFTAAGPIRTNNEYDGEEYDATKEFPGWNSAGFDDSQWLKAELVQAPGGKLDAQMNESIWVMDTIKPVSISQLKKDVWILDMGQNMAGWVQMRVKGNRGDKVTLRYAETLQPNNELYVANLRDAKVTDMYTLKGGSEETWHPVFVYHGFRYVEISGYPGKPELADFEGQVVYDALPTIGHFETSNPIVNKIYHNAYWGILSNYKGMPVDCPQRNERMPWLGDRAVGSLGESFVFANGNFYAKWLDDIAQSQKPDGAIPDVAPAYWNYYSDNMTWPGTYILVADMLYRQFADKAPIEKHYASMKKWMDYMRVKYMKNNIVTKDKYGDWCVPPESLELIHAKDSSLNTDGQLIATAYYYHLSGLMGKFAAMLHKPADAQFFATMQLNVAMAFNDKYFDKATSKYSNNTVTANLLPLYFGITPLANKQAVFKNIVAKINEAHDHISTGVIGTQWLMRGLTEFGRPDLAWKIASNTTYPSWGYMAERGATTIWELWNGDTANPAMNSRNHIMLLGDLIAWFYQDIAGIKTVNAGFMQLVMQPAIIKGLDSVNASYQTAYGLVKSSYNNTTSSFNWHVTIPPNSSALVYVPAKAMDEVTGNGRKVSAIKDVKPVKMENGKAVLSIGSGDYDFEVKY
ncbi:Bacterial alpha-L-rhamnosidase [Mucilaginibacter rubeus]|uniref:alpha-L-rhamnosidase n=1 Tax=Mucilaginibacter rubeus TaxID=2027860 RepID=A0AAE6JGS4_9SPHI|nr:MULTISPECIES: alpha-L-rhamnosidase [Mucilaginibacter]QEM05275.1 Bacterial alpha-L-rhamnosidase [Mucilaginibacter rubeus]QEM17866.1 Bacterial alpha-L-rhamnosidase [Mucilaginibacter gossypii]QTE45601.1 family 78 glycoside hydrolase catalytic domain [Mucilaginibacter rubeus]QTE52198.1 family 78 glycoside hydrolase catalytic domain [Mucilaginibacter rubeus]QTE57287.1 family 78 glycoside hydrolase catalytic domain [Mucilaginibacter rubeus]